MAKDRGRYVSTYCVIVDSPEYARLGPNATAVLWALKHFPESNRAGIFPIFREQVSERSKVPIERVPEALRELEREQWIRTEGRWCWIRNHLRFDPSHKPENPKHVKGVLDVLAGLPRIALVDAFLDYYRTLRNEHGVPFLPPGSPVAARSESNDDGGIAPQHSDSNQTAVRSESNDQSGNPDRSGDSNPVSVSVTTAVSVSGAVTATADAQGSDGAMEPRCPRLLERGPCNAPLRRERGRFAGQTGGKGWYCPGKHGGCGTTFDRLAPEVVGQLSAGARGALFRELEAEETGADVKRKAAREAKRAQEAPELQTERAIVRAMLAQAASEPDACAGVWDAALARLERTLNRHSFATWFLPTTYLGSLRDGEGLRLVVRVPNAQFVEWLAKNYRDAIGAALAAVGRPEVGLAMVTVGHEEEVA